MVASARAETDKVWCNGTEAACFANTAATHEQSATSLKSNGCSEKRLSKAAQAHMSSKATQNLKPAAVSPRIQIRHDPRESLRYNVADQCFVPC